MKSNVLKKHYLYTIIFVVSLLFGKPALTEEPFPKSFTALIIEVDTAKLYEGLRYGYFFNTWTPACFYYTSRDCFANLLKDKDMVTALTTGEVAPYISGINQAIEKATVFANPSDTNLISEDWYNQFYLITYTLLNKALMHFQNGQPQEAIKQLTLIHKFIQLYDDSEITSSEASNFYVHSIRQLYTQYLDLMLNHNFLQPYLKDAAVMALFNFNEDNIRHQYLKKDINRITNESQDSLEPLPNIEFTASIETLNDEELILALIRMMAYEKNHFISNNPTLTQKIQNYLPQCEVLNDLDDTAIVASQDQTFFITFFDTCLSTDSILRTASINDIIQYLKNSYPIDEGIEEYQQAMQNLLFADANDIMTIGIESYEQHCQDSQMTNKFCLRLMDSLSQIAFLDEVLAYQYLIHLKYEILKNNLQPKNIDALLLQQQNFIQNNEPMKKIIWNAVTHNLQTDIVATPDKQTIPIMNTDDRFYVIKILFNAHNSE